MEEASGVYTSLFLDTNELIMAVRAQKVPQGFQEIMGHIIRRGARYYYYSDRVIRAVHLWRANYYNLLATHCVQA